MKFSHFHVSSLKTKFFILLLANLFVKDYSNIQT